MTVLPSSPAAWIEGDLDGLAVLRAFDFIMCLAVLFAFHGLESVAGAKVLLGCLADWFRQLAHFDLILRSQHLAVGVGNDIFHVPAADGWPRDHRLLYHAPPPGRFYQLCRPP